MMDAQSSRNCAITMQTPAAMSCVGWSNIDVNARMVATANDAVASPNSYLLSLNIVLYPSEKPPTPISRGSGAKVFMVCIESRSNVVRYEHERANALSNEPLSHGLLRNLSALIPTDNSGSRSTCGARNVRQSNLPSVLSM